MYMSILLTYIYIYVPLCMPNACEVGRVSDPFVLELQRDVIYHVSAGN